MADLGFGGRVLAGEDSEEDDEEEQEFQFGSSRAAAPAPVVVQSTVQPKFSVQAPAAGAEDDESDDETDEDAPSVDLVQNVPAVDAETAPTPERTPRVSIDSNARSISRPTTPELPMSLHVDAIAIHRDAYEEDWIADGTVDGVAMMGHSIVEKLQPSVDSTIRRIAELTDSQQRLLTLLNDQHKWICSNDQIENVAIVMGKLPQYIKKVQGIKAAMSEISSSVERMKKRSESLRVDAQSHAIKKENKRESQNQWNKLYAAKSFEGVTMSTTISSSVSVTPPPPPST